MSNASKPGGVLRIVLGVVALLTVTVACGSGKSARSARTSSQSENQTLDNASIAVIDRQAWIVGGYLTDEDDAHTSNTLAVAVAASGGIQDKVRLALPSHRFLFNARSLGLQGSQFFVGTLCTIPVAGANGCTDPGSPALFRRSGREASPITLDSNALVSADNQPGINIIEPVGSVGSQILLLRSGQPGTYPGTSQVALFSVNVASGDVELETLPPGVMTLGSVCSFHSHIFAASPVITNGRVSAIDVYSAQLGETDQLPWSKTVKLRVDEPTTTGGRLYCSGTTGVTIRVDHGASSEFFAVDQSTRHASDINGDPPLGRITFVAETSAGLLVTSTDDGAIYYIRLSGGEWRRLGSRQAAPNARPELPAAVSIGERTVDVGALVFTPPSEITRGDTQPRAIQ